MHAALSNEGQQFPLSAGTPPLDLPLEPLKFSFGSLISIATDIYF
jgi:hypothetical protein